MERELMDLLHRLVEAEERLYGAIPGTDEHAAAAYDAEWYRRAIYDLWPVEPEVLVPA